MTDTWGRVAQASDLAGITSEAGAPSFAYFFCEGRESEMPAPSGFDHVSTTKSNGTRSIASHPCKKRKDGAPSVEMVHTQIVKDGPPAYFDEVVGALAARCFSGLFANLN